MRHRLHSLITLIIQAILAPLATLQGISDPLSCSGGPNGLPVTLDVDVECVFYQTCENISHGSCSSSFGLTYNPLKFNFARALPKTIWPDRLEAAVRSTLGITKSMLEPDCKNVSYLPDVDNCKVYSSLCSDGRKIKHSCEDDGSCFDPETLSCVTCLELPLMLPCKQDLDVQIQHTIIENCSIYLICQNKTKVKDYCPPGLQFYPDTYMCEEERFMNFAPGVSEGPVEKSEMVSHHISYVDSAAEAFKNSHFSYPECALIL